METKGKIKVLFICVHNSAKSQMAEALLNYIGGDRYEAVSAELKPGELNPLAVEVLREVRLDISYKQTQEVFEVYKSGRFFPYVITVCDETNTERCPIFPSFTKRLHWSFPDPSEFTGTMEEKLEKTREVRNQVGTKLREFAKSQNTWSY